MHQMLHIYLIRQVKAELINCIWLLLVKTSTVLLCARKWKMLNRLRIIHLKQTPMMVKKKKRNKEHIRVFVWEPCSLCEHLHMLQKQLTFRSCPFELEQTDFYAWHIRKISLDDLFLSFRSTSKRTRRCRHQQ